MAVGRGEGLEWRRPRVASAKWPWHLPGGEVANEGVLEQRDLTIEHTDVDHLAEPAALALMQGRQNADRHVQPCGKVPQRKPRPYRRPVRLTRDAHEATHPLHDNVESRPGSLGPGLAEAGDRGIYE